MLGLIRERKFPLVGGGTAVWSFIHLEDAAAATVAALGHDGSDVFHVVDDEPAPVAEWLPYIAEVMGAKPPLRLPAWVGRLAAGEVLVRMTTQLRGASNEKAARPCCLLQTLMILFVLGRPPQRPGPPPHHEISDGSGGLGVGYGTVSGVIVTVPSARVAAVELVTF